MKTLQTITLALGAIALLGTTTLRAQSAVANIPFDFAAQRAALSAGRYELKSLNPTSDTIQIINLDTSKSVVVLAPRAMSDPARKDPGSGKVIFHRYGDRYFFSEVWVPSGLHGRVRISKAEAEVKANSNEKMASVWVPLNGQ